jgi:hypothetical protein
VCAALGLFAACVQQVGISLVPGDLSGSSFGSVARLVQDCKIVLIICFVGFRCVSRSVEDAVAGSLLPRLLGFIGLRPVVAHALLLRKNPRRAFVPLLMSAFTPKSDMKIEAI